MRSDIISFVFVNHYWYECDWHECDKAYHCSLKPRWSIGYQLTSICILSKFSTFTSSFEQIYDGFLKQE